ncbi:MAG: RecX family transcriptional regulator [Bacteroidaceae bacterium]|nr:RecX family transcriptional regulator [Bacteroidaceae bacterium]MBO4841202.1 RecX family transcriptional regulator [Bacteroidaceae bacterium]
MKPLTYEQALLRAASLCSGSEHCSSEIRKKLLLWGVTSSQSEKIILYLINEKYIDNKRFCRAYCLDKFRYNHWGRIKIGQMLRMLEMESEDINEGLESINEEDYKEVLLHILTQKNRQLKDSDAYIRKGKLIRHAMSRGFESYVINEVLQQLQ